MALAAAGDWAAAELQLERLRARGRTARHATLPEVVVPLLEGLHAFARGEYAQAVAKIEPLEGRIVEVGGSHAQREVFEDTLLQAYFKTGRFEQAESLLRKRLSQRSSARDAIWLAQAEADGKKRAAAEPS